MPLPFALLPWILPAITGTAAAGKFAQSQMGQNLIRGGQKVASKIPNWAQGLQNYMFSTQANIPQHLQKSKSVLSALPPTFATQYLTDPELMKQEAKDVLDISESISEGLGNKINSLFDKDIIKTKKVKKKKKKKKERLESKKKQRKIKEKEEPSIPEYDAEGGLITMHEGGDTKKKKKGYAKKRKHYRASGFVKMKKKKKYIT